MSQGFLLYNELTKILPGVITQVFRELLLENGSVVRTFSDLTLGDAEVLRDLMTTVGDAEVVGASATDIPAVDAGVTQDRYKVLTLAAGMSVDMNTEEALKRSGKWERYLQTKTNTVRRVIAELSQKITAFGRAASGITGFLNNPNCTVVNSSFNPWNSLVDAREFRSWLISEIQAFYRASNYTMMPDSIACTPDLGLRMEELLLENNVPLLDYIRGETRRIRNFHELPECASALLEANGVHSSGLNLDRVVLFNSSELVMERHNMPATLAPAKYVQIRNLTEFVPMYSLITPVMINQPQFVRYITVARNPNA